MKRALIIFVRNPELGKVKTRLAKDIGDEKALNVYRQLLQHTHDISIHTGADRYVYYADSIHSNDIWEDILFRKRIQKGEGLGERMNAAFEELFCEGYKPVVIIGSDCPGLTTAILNEAFSKLETNEVVLGPAADGGYYLLGLGQPIPSLFDNKQWSTGTVFKETLKDIINGGNLYSLLPELTDIDTADDLRHFNT